MFEKYYKRTRQRKYVYNRYLIFYYLYNVKNLTLIQVSKKTGYDHSTIIHGLKQFKNLITDKYFIELTSQLGRKLLPEIYNRPKEIEISIKQKINIELQNMGVDCSDKYAIIGQIGDRVFTVDGFQQFINKMI